jgi:mRNA deadenylase 3'-5' endonuclease subunit Ccr4
VGCPSQDLLTIALFSKQQLLKLSAFTHLICPFLFARAADSLQPEALLELLNEEDLRKDTGLPSPEWSSDHIALLAEFRYKPRQRR